MEGETRAAQVSSAEAIWRVVSLPRAMEPASAFRQALFRAESAHTSFANLAHRSCTLLACLLA